MEKLTRRYMAGLLDGEGYFGIMRNKYKNGRRKYVPTIKMSLTHPTVLRLIVSKLGGHISTRYWANANWKPAYCWQVNTFVTVKRVLDYVQEYLIIKSEQGKVLREYLDTINKNLGAIPMPEEILAEREKLCRLMSKLNYRGIPPAENKRESSKKLDEAMFRTSVKTEEAVGNYCTVA